MFAKIFPLASLSKCTRKSTLYQWNCFSYSLHKLTWRVKCEVCENEFRTRRRRRRKINAKSRVSVFLSLAFCIKLRSAITLCLLMYRVFRDTETADTETRGALDVCMFTSSQRFARRERERERSEWHDWPFLENYHVTWCTLHVFVSSYAQWNKVTKGIKVAHHFFRAYNLQVNWSLETSWEEAKQVKAICEWKRSLKLTRRRSSYRLRASCIVVCASCFIAEQWQSEWFINWCGRRHLFLPVFQCITRVS